jgi:hypothetical protein
LSLSPDPKSRTCNSTAGCFPILFVFCFLFQFSVHFKFSRTRKKKKRKKKQVPGVQMSCYSKMQNVKKKES